MLRVVAAVAVVVLIIAVIVFGPMLTIWALNTLAGSNIPINLATWFAALWLGALLGGSSGSSK